MSSFFIGLLVTAPTSAFAASCTLAYSLTPSTSVINSGNTITYAVSLKNTGGAVCRNTSYSIYYAPNETFVSATPAARASNYYWYIGNLAPGKRVTATVTTRHNPSIDGATVDAEGCASADNAADSCSDSSVTINATASAVTQQPAVTSPVSVTTTPTQSTTSTTQSGTLSTTQSTTIGTTQSGSTLTTSMAQPTIPNGKEQGIWVWNYPSQMNTPTGAQQLQTLSSKGFNVIYLTIDDYLNIASLPAGPDKDAQKAAYFSTLSQVVQKANSLGMTVDVEAGWRDWAYQSNRWKGFALIDAMKEYNASHPNTKIRNFQYDVEPYLLPEYETNKAQVLTDYVSFIDQSAQRLAGSDLGFGLCIPHFYDDVAQWTPTITYNGVTDYTYNQLLRVLEQKPGSQILLMSYRNFFSGTNGTQQISQTEVEEASAGGYSTKVIVGQETGNVDPAYVTYYGTSQTAVLNALSTISGAYGKYSNFQGTAVDYMDPFLALPQ